MSTPRATRAAGAIALLLSGCASPSGPERGAMTLERAQALLAPDASRPAIAALAATAERERAAPGRRVDAPGLAEALGLGRIDEPTDPARAAARIDEATSAIEGQVGEAPEPDMRVVTPDDRETAAYLVSVAREHIETGEIDDALVALAKAESLDPTNAEAAETRMRALLAGGRRLEAIEAAESARALGSRAGDVALLGWLGAPEGSASDAALAPLLVALADAGSLDAAPRSLGAIAAGEALIERGWLSAGGRLILDGLDSLPSPTADSPWRPDLVRAIGRTDELRLAAGDALLGAGDPEAALRAYSGVAGAESAKRSAVAQIRTGRPASAALGVIERVRADGSPPTRGEIAVLERCAQEAGVRETLGRALLELRSEFEGGPATVRAEMTRAAALVLGGADGGRALRAHLAVDSPDVRVAMQLLDGAASTRGRVREAVSLTRLRPEHARRWGAALLAGEAPPAEVMAELENETGWAVSMLAAGAELQRQRPGHALGILAGLGEGDRGDAAMLLRAEAGAESGRWDAATDAITRLEQDPDADPVLLLGALRGTQQLGRAYALAESLLTEFDPDVETLLLASEIALQLPEPRDAELFLQTASELDPFDERVYAALLGLYAPGGPLADESQMTRLRRLLRENRPNGVLAALYDARDMAEDGLVVEAEARLREIALRDPDEPGVYELLLRVWSMQRAVNAEDPVLEDAAAWLMERLAARPGSPPIGAALARVFVELGRPERAVQVLEEVDRRIGAPVLASMREQIIARDLGEPERAREMSLARLDRPALSIDDAIARAFLEAQGGDAASSLATLESSLPAFATLTTDQRTRLGHVATAALVALNAGDLSRDDLGSRAGPVLAIIDLASDRGAPLSDPVLDGRLRIAALDPGRDADELADLASRVAGGDDARLTTTFGTIVGGLLTTKQYLKATELCVIGATRAGTIDGGLLIDAVAIAGQFGGEAETRALLARLDESGRTLEAARHIWNDPPPEGKGPADVRAEIAYQAAGRASIFGRDDAAEEMYRIALEHVPDHLWTSNDLGYMLADAGRELAEAERMIESAYARQPDSHNVTDSLGWVRYKLGRFEDEGGREGAITILSRAITMGEGANSSTLHDHLGDALWRAGRREEAEKTWLDAEVVGGQQIRIARRGAGRDDPTVRRLEQRRDMIRAKLLAIEAGEAPPVAPLGEGVAEPSSGDERAATGTDDGQE